MYMRRKRVINIIQEAQHSMHLVFNAYLSHIKSIISKGHHDGLFFFFRVAFNLI